MNSELQSKTPSDARTIVVVATLASAPLLTWLSIQAFLAAARIRFGHWPTFIDPQPTEIGWGVAHDVLCCFYWLAFIAALTALALPLFRPLGYSRIIVVSTWLASFVLVVIGSRLLVTLLSHPWFFRPVGK